MAAIYYSMPIALENNRSESFENFATQRGLRGYLLKGWEILNTNPTRETEDVIGIATTQSEITKGGLVSDACEYHNDFLRGDSAYLGEFTYRLAEDPIRYPFKAAIKDNREFDILDREKSDGTMAMIPLYIYEYNVKGYVNPDNYLEKPEAPSYNARRFYRHFFHKSIKSLR